MILEKPRVFSHGKKKWHSSVDCKMGSPELWCGPSHLCSICCALGERPLQPHLSPTPRHLCPHPQSLGICHLTWPQGLRTLIKSRILIRGEDPRFSEWAQCLLSSIREIRGREAQRAERRSMVLMAVMSPGTSVSFPLLTVLCVIHTHPTNVPDTWCDPPLQWTTMPFSEGTVFPQDYNGSWSVHLKVLHCKPQKLCWLKRKRNIGILDNSQNEEDCENGGGDVIYVSEWVKVTQSCPTLCDSVDCSPPGSSVHEILQARILEWVAIPFPRGIYV